MRETSNETRLKLPQVLDLAAAPGLLGTLRQRLQGQTVLHLDASRVEILTLPCAQILLAALRNLNALTIDEPSLAFVKALDELALDLPEDRVRHGESIPESAISAQEQGNAHTLNHNQSDEQAMTKRILTIDDSKTIRDMLMITLSDAGFEVLQAVDGQDGLDVLAKENVDVVITDINMPRMDGYEVIRRLRSGSTHQSMPILVLTTESEVEKKNIARVAGATGWIVKPFDPDRLIETVRKVAR